MLIVLISSGEKLVTTSRYCNDTGGGSNNSVDCKDLHYCGHILTGPTNYIKFDL